MPAVKDSVSWHDTIQYKEIGHLSGKRCPACATSCGVTTNCGVIVRCYSCYANGLRFDSRLVDFCFFSLPFSRLRLGVMFRD